MARFKGGGRKDGREDLHVLIDADIKRWLWESWGVYQEARAVAGLPLRPLGMLISRFFRCAKLHRDIFYACWRDQEIAALRAEGWEECRIEAAMARLEAEIVAREGATGRDSGIGGRCSGDDDPLTQGEN